GYIACKVLRPLLVPGAIGPLIFLLQELPPLKATPPELLRRSFIALSCYPDQRLLWQSTMLFQQYSLLIFDPRGK
ncbi:MAG TPA: hypothetical protein VGC95_11600, partial [Chitinophagaceae bacterium]